MALKGTIFITKDAMCTTYFPVYGNTYWNTPNIDELAKRGTVFERHYTAAPSTYMACVSMFTGKYPYETKQKYYLPNKEDYGITLWEKARQKGYSCHTVWTESWVSWVKRQPGLYSGVSFHTIPDFKQSVGAHFPHKDALKRDDSKCEKVKDHYRRVLEEIVTNDKQPFVWVHFPHVINGRIAYGDDLDVFDDCIGITREFFSDDEIYISSDHGNMNGLKGKVCYGFDVNEPAVRIPFITPRLEGVERVGFPTVNIDMYTFLFEKKITKRDYVITDCMYYCQPKRKTAIIHGDYKLIYNKADKTSELYDLAFDPNENCNMFEDSIYDPDRKIMTPLREVYFYPNWDDIEREKEYLTGVLREMWRDPTVAEKLTGFSEDRAKAAYKAVRTGYRKLKAKKRC